MWSDAESNHGHEDFQSSALPTELSDQSQTYQNKIYQKKITGLKLRLINLKK